MSRNSDGATPRMVKLGDVLHHWKDTVHVDDPLSVPLISVKLYGNGAVRREIGDGKAPKPFTGNRGHAGQFVFSRIWARRGAMALIPEELDGVVVTNEFPLFDVDEKELDSRYLNYLVQTQSFLGELERISAGASGQNRVKEAAFLNIHVPLPSLEEQGRIVAVLDRADAVRAKRRQILADLDELETNLFLEFFGKCDNHIELGALIIEGPANGLYRPQSDYGSGTCILRIDGFYDGKVLLDRLKRVSIPESEMRRYGLLKGDIVINRVNSLQYLGKSALIPDLREPVVYESNMMRFRVDENLVLPLYVVAWLQTRNATDQIARCAKRAVNQASINQKDVKSLRVPLPPIELQKEFARRVEAIAAVRAKVERALALDDELFAALQSRAFRGAL